MRWISRSRSMVRPVRVGQLVERGLPLQLLGHLPLDAQHPVHVLDHVHRDADGAGLVGDGPGDGLADPPRGVGRELEALRVVELLDRPHQAEVALLHQVEQEHPPADVALGDRHHEPEVGLDELGAGHLPVARPGAARRRRSQAGSSTSDVAIRSSASCPASMRWASSRSSSPVSRLTRPISLRYSRTVSDVPPSPLRSPPDAEGRRCAGATSGRGRRCRPPDGPGPSVGVTSSSSTSSSTRMPRLRQPGAHGGDDVLGQLDLRHHRGRRRPPRPSR